MAAIMALSARILMPHDGRLIAEGAPCEVAVSPAVIDAYVGERYLIA